jgi:uncharacterized repeat protein (TIGR01451 family)
MDLPDGTYRVEVDVSTLPGGSAGWTQTYDDGGALDDTSNDVVLNTAAPSFIDADFSYSGNGSVGDAVFWDIDQSADGDFSAADAALPAIAVDLIWAGFDDTFGTDDDIAHPATETSPLGLYNVGNLVPGRYRVTVDLGDPDFPLGLTAQTWDVEHTDPGGPDGDPSNVVEVVLAAGQDRVDVDFSFAGTGSISDFLWLDLDNDGEKDPGEPGIPSVTITATWFGPDGVVGGGDDQLLTSETDSAGNYRFDGLPAGSFDVRIDTTDPDFPQGVVATYDVDGVVTADHAVVVLASGEVRDDVDFGYAGTGSLGDMVWLDFDGDGTVNGPDVGLSGVALDLVWFGADGILGTGDDVAVRFETDADGVYAATALPLGDYAVTVDTSTLAPGLTASFDVDGGLDSTAQLTLTSSPLDRSDVDFGFRGTGEIGDLVWLDTDANGALDGAEVGIDGVDIEVRLAGVDGTLDTGDDIVVAATTAGGGLYGVDGLPEGPVSVLVTGGLPADHAQVSGPDASLDALWSGVLGSGESLLDVDFGFRPDADLSVAISHDGDFIVGENETISITVVNAGPADAETVVVTTTLPTGLGFVSAAGMDCVALNQVVTCTVPTLANGDSIVADLVVTVDEAAAPSFVASATVDSSTPDRDPTNNTALDPIEVPLADLSVDVSVPSTLAAGLSGAVSVAISNAGPSTSEAVVVTVNLPPGVTYKSVLGEGWVCAVTGSSVTCTLADPLASGASAPFELAVEVSNAVSGNVSISAVVTSVTPQASTAVDSDSLTASVTSADLLAATGRESGWLLGLAAILIIVGSVLVLADQRKRARPVVPD